MNTLTPADLLPGDIIQLGEPCTVVIVDAEPGDPCPVVIVRVGDPDDEGPLASVTAADLAAHRVTDVDRTPRCDVCGVDDETAGPDWNPDTGCCADHSDPAQLRLAL